MSIAAAGRPFIMSDLVASAYPSRRLFQIRSWTFLGISAAMAVASLVALNLLEAAIVASAQQQGYRGSIADLEPLDKRNGYTHKQVSSLLRAWGPHGRSLYLLIEAIDTALFITGYRGVLVVLFNRLGTFLATRLPAPMASRVHFIALGPVIAAACDLLENAAQVAVVASFIAAPTAAAQPWWWLLVQVASMINKTKWVLVKAVFAGGGVLGLLAPGLALQERAGGAKKQE